MKNYHFTTKILFAVYKWITLDITWLPICDTLFKFSVDWKRNCSMPGVLVNISLFKLFNIWFQIFDERVLDDKTKKLVDPFVFSQRRLSPAQIKDADGLLRAFIYWSPRFDQMFHTFDHLPEPVLAYKQQFSELSNEMENYLREAITPKP